MFVPAADPLKQIVIKTPPRAPIVYDVEEDTFNSLAVKDKPSTETRKLYNFEDYANSVLEMIRGE